jgi:alpha-L-rhamnosidase
MFSRTIVAIGLVAAMATGATPAQGFQSALSVSELRAGYRTNPVGIDDPAPDLSWASTSPASGQRQTAYEIVASSTSYGFADLWDTGKVVSSKAAGVPYAGRPLASRQRVYWRVKVWDQSGRASGWSAPAYWEMGLLKPSDWQASWISNPQWTPPQPHPIVVTLPSQDARYLRLDVSRLGLPLKENGFPDPVSRLQLAEIAVSDSADSKGKDLAIGAGVTASESFTVGGYWEPRFVTDGSLTTEQAPLGYTSDERNSQDLGTSPIWLQVDLGATKHFDQVLLYPRTDTLTADGRTANFPENYRLSTSNVESGPFVTAADVIGQEPPPPYRVNPAALPILAKQFDLGKRISSARLYATGLGVYVATINGKPVSNSVLEPGDTDFVQRVEYSTYDVTSLLRRGSNAIGIQLGNGTANAVDTTRWSKLHNSKATPRALAQLEVTYADGSSQLIGTDTSWRTIAGATTFSSWYGGEDFDARRLQAGWDRPGADLSAWQAAIVVGPPAAGTVLSARVAPSIEIVGTHRTIAITQSRPGIYVADLGVNFAGWPELSVSGPAGMTVTLRPGELLNSDGTVSQATTGSPIYDRYTLAGSGVQKWHPQFAYHGFRYVQLEGLPSAPTLNTVTGLTLRTNNASAGSFTSSNAMLNKIHGIIDQAIQNNMYSVLTDCPHREKLGWLEQSQLVFGSVSRNYDVAAYYRSIMRNVGDAQTPEGLVPDIAPELDVFVDGFRDDPNWGGMVVLGPLQMYQAYGDVSTLRQYYPMMARYAQYLENKSAGDLLAYGLGDWIAFDQSTPLGVTATFGYYRVVDAMAQIATILGKDASHWNVLRARIAAAFNAAFLDRDRHTYGSGSQASDALALAMGVVPADQRAGVLAHLIESLQGSGWLVSVGEIALPSLFRVLSTAGRDDLIYQIATQTANPSYGYQVEHGATALTERWDGPTSGESQDHFMLGAIDEWFTSGLAGIRQAPGSVGFRQLVIKPAIVGDLSRVSGRYVTPSGPVTSTWRRSAGVFHLDITIPPNTTATVDLPDHRTITVGSGSWHFTAR